MSSVEISGKKVPPITESRIFRSNKVLYSRFPHMLKTASKLYFCAILPFILLAGSVAQQDAPPPLTSASNDFVQQILSRSGSPSAITVTFQNVSGLPQEAQESLQNLIFTAFRNSGTRLVKAEQALAEVQVAFSEDWQGYVWIASIKQGSASQLVIRKVARPQRTASSRTPTLTIRKITVWQQDGAILDFFQDKQNLVVLEPGQLSLYVNDSGQWRPRQTLGVTHQHEWPRDLRGRLQVNGGQINIFLPSVRCSGTISPPSLDCRTSDDPWPVDQGSLVAFFSPRRNFFTGLLAGQTAGASVPPFFSGATWQNGDTRQWLFAGIDGRVRVFQNDLAATPATLTDFGGLLAVVRSGCGSGWQVLASAPTDSTHPDSIQAVEIVGREALPASSPVDLSGSVEALWTAGKESQVVNGVLQSQATGKYEAFTLTVSCNQ